MTTIYLQRFDRVVDQCYWLLTWPGIVRRLSALLLLSMPPPTSYSWNDQLVKVACVSEPAPQARSTVISLCDPSTFSVPLWQLSVSSAGRRLVQVCLLASELCTDLSMFMQLPAWQFDGSGPYFQQQKKKKNQDIQVSVRWRQQTSVRPHGGSRS